MPPTIGDMGHDPPVDNIVVDRLGHVGEPSTCALGVPGTVCSTPSTIATIRSKLLIAHTDTITETTDDASVMRAAKTEAGCSTELCVLTNSKFSKDLTSSDLEESTARIKPPGPSKTTALLNNDNIDNVLRNLSYLHRGYYHMNFQMIDFAGERDGRAWRKTRGQLITPTELGSINLVRDVIGKGYDTFGVVLNTDVRTNGGIHWFSIFCDFRSTPNTLEYFNSSGNKPMVQVQDWLIKTEKMMNNSPEHLSKIVILSGLAHQKDSETECGLYSLYYIWNRLNGIPYSAFQAKRIPDSLMIKFRGHCFSGD